MPLPRWLTNLLVPQKAMTDRAEASRREVEELARRVHETYIPSPEYLDHSARIHRAAHDPDFPQKREAAVKAITAAIDAVATRHGFTRKAKSWAADGPKGRVSIQMQRSRYGFDCYINLGFDPANDRRNGVWARDDFVRLGDFYRQGETREMEQGVILYLDVHEDPAALDLPMRVLDQRALPWLLGQAKGAAPELPRA